MSFMDALQKTLTPKQLTENGALGYATTNSSLLDFNFRIPSYRGDSDSIVQDFLNVLQSSDPYVFKYLAYLRNIRGGLGERNTFRVALDTLVNYSLLKSKTNNDILDLFTKIIYPLITQYGRYDDFYCILGKNIFLDSCILDSLHNQLLADLDSMKNSESCSLLAKWLPSENASSQKTKQLAKKIRKAFNMNSKQYRKTLSSLRKYLDVVEVKACSNNWSEINYNTVPSKANIKYKDAFLRHDTDRRTEYLNALTTGKEGVKINSATNYPHDIVSAYVNRTSYYYRRNDLNPDYVDATLEALWKALPQLPGLNNTLVIRDGSGSMLSCIPNSAVSALSVADALSIYCSERCTGPYKDNFITFSSKPQFVSLAGKDTLYEKLAYLQNFDDCSNTDLKKTFDLILKTAIDNKLSQEDLPKQLLIVSDMEFDSVSYDDTDTLMEIIEQEYNDAGYNLPKLIFWNVNGRTNTIPFTKNNAGVILTSGFSVNIINMILNGETDSYKALIHELENSIYENIPYLG